MNTQSAKKYNAPNLILITLFALMTGTSACSSNATTTALSSFEYQVHVQSKETGIDLANTQVRIEVGTQAPLIEITDANGTARIFIDSSREGQPARLIVEAPGYKKYVQNIDLRKGILPTIIQLEAEESQTVPNLIPETSETTKISTTAPQVIVVTATTDKTSSIQPITPPQQLEPQFDPNDPEGFLRWYFHEIWDTRNYDYLWDYLSNEFRQRLDQDFSTYESNWSAIGSIQEPIDIAYEGKDGSSLKYRVQYTTLSKKSGFTDHRNGLYWLYFNSSKGHWEFK